MLKLNFLIGMPSGMFAIILTFIVSIFVSGGFPLWIYIITYLIGHVFAVMSYVKDDNWFDKRSQET